MKQTQVLVPTQMLVEMEYKPYMTTYFALKAINKSGHFKEISKQYKQLAEQLEISESKLRKDVKSLITNSFASIIDNKLCLVSKWRNPIINRPRVNTEKCYRKLKKTKINPTDLKRELALAKIASQLNRQKYREKKSEKRIYKNNTIKGRAKTILAHFTENGKISERKGWIQQNDNLNESQKELAFENYRKGLKLVSGALASHLLMKEGNSIGKECSISQSKLADIWGVKSLTTARRYVNVLEISGLLTKERDMPRRIYHKRFNPNKHFKDTFGNIYSKECYRYDIQTKPNQSNVVKFTL